MEVLGASEAVPIPVAIHLVCQRQFLEAESRDGDLEAEVVGWKMPLGDVVAVEVEVCA